MTEQIVKPKTLGGWVRCVSGLFITKENPKGITPKELTILSALLSIGKSTVDKDLKEELAIMTNQTLQVTVNYLNKLKRKGIITPEGRIHPIFFKKKIIIEWNPEQYATQSSSKRLPQS